MLPLDLAVRGVLEQTRLDRLVFVSLATGLSCQATKLFRHWIALV